MKYFTEQNIFRTLVAIIVIGIPFYIGLSIYQYWYEELDGTPDYNPIITYINDTNPLNFKVEKKEYKRGEMVYYYSQFCKNRPAQGYITWSLFNTRVFLYSPSDPKELPVGCTSRALYPIQRIPNEAVNGEHHFEGVVTQTLPDGRVRKFNIKTESFKVI